jgi:hypothetical protein
MAGKNRTIEAPTAAAAAETTTTIDHEIILRLRETTLTTRRNPKALGPSLVHPHKSSVPQE